MNYTPTIWENGKAPAINADNLNKIENELVRLGDILGGEYALASEAGYSLDASMNDEYVLTLSLKNKDEGTLSSKSIDLPIESMIIDVGYADGDLTLTLQNGNTIDVSIDDIVSGLVSESRKIAGMDLTSDISVEDLQSTLEILSLKDDVEDLKNSGAGSGSVSGDYALASEAGYSIDASVNDEYVLSFSLKNKVGEELSNKSVGLPVDDIVSGLVPKSRKIAGMELTSDIVVGDLQNALGILSLEKDIEDLKNSGGSGGSGSGDSTIRYVNDESDSNFDWIQVKNSDGTWLNWKRAYIANADVYLFYDGDEFADITGGFARYSGEGTITNDGAYLQIVGKQNTSQGTTSYYGTNEIIDLSAFSSIEVVFSADLTKGSANAISFGVSATKGGEFASVQNYTWNNNYTNETSVIDVSNIDSGYFQIYEKSGYSTKASIVSIKLVK